jgi:glutamate synthase domain-containing protein 3
VNRALIDNGLREAVELRVDGGISVGLDIVLGAVLGADGFDFGKLLLVAEGCIMARVCEKNTCPTGIATHAERFKKKYKGTAEHVEELLTVLATDVRRILAEVGVVSLADLFGRVDLLEYHPGFEELRSSRGLSCEGLLQAIQRGEALKKSPYSDGVSSLNTAVLEVATPALQAGKDVTAEFPIAVTDRAIPATLSGAISKKVHQRHMEQFGVESDPTTSVANGSVSLTFVGSAGQGFGVLLQDGVTLTLKGEANDSVCKTMSGGQVVIVPDDDVQFDPAKNMIIGNCALYGATGGRLFVQGRAGDRFAVRNSGAIAVIEGAGLHACEYMTSGTVVILGPTGYNVGAGMTGGTLYLSDVDVNSIHHEYLEQVDIDQEGQNELAILLKEYVKKTGSLTAAALVMESGIDTTRISKWIPRS